jgi:diguanylate cyclase (GGDEF)-like protein
VITPKPEAGATLAARALNLVNGGVIVLDVDQHIVLWNGWLTPRCGRAASRVLGRSLFEVFPELRGSRVEAAVLAALSEEIATAIPQTDGRSPFPLRAAGSFDGPLIEQAVSVSPFREEGALFCLVEIRDVSSAFERERRLLDHAETMRARSYVDGLTGIANRRYFDVALDRELRRAQRVGGTLSLLLTDIDSFKAYNDHFGHQQGDTCLSAVAQALAARLKRPADVAARYGGEEFVVLLPECNVESATIVLERVRERLALALTAGRVPAFTVSFGIASSSDADTFDEVLAVADHALLSAKAAGRNRVLVAVDSVDPSEHPNEQPTAPESPTPTEALPY